MKRLRLLLLALAVVALAAPPASADPVLFEWAFNTDGTIDYMPAGPLVPGYIFGPHTLSVSGAGAHYLAAFFDYEIDEDVNTFFNEYGAVGEVAPGAGISWEIDEPGWTFGDIYLNFLASVLDNSNGVPSTAVEDVSFALGWNVVLLAGETAFFTFNVADVAPSGFYLRHTDPDSGVSLYFSADTRVETGQTQVPEPASILLLGAGLGVVGWRRLRRR